MTDINRKSALDLELRDLLSRLDQDGAPRRIRAPGREARMIGLDDEITVSVVVDPGQHDQIIESLRSIELPSSKKIEISGTKGVLLVTLPVKALRDVENLTGIESVEVSAELLLPRLDRARSEAGLPAVIPIPTDESSTGLEQLPHTSIEAKYLTGKGVVIATVDSGIDWRHGDFRHPNGETRIAQYVWWGDEEGNGTGEEPESFGIGRREPEQVYSADDINRALNGSHYIAHRDPRGHGTHCMSIAAGNGRASNHFEFQGVAPEATIMALGTTHYTNTPVLWGIQNFFEQAGDRPAVISLSYGGHRGSHDGTSAVEKAIERQTGEGRIVVVAAGNEAEDGIHWQGNVSTGGEIEIPVRIGDDSYQWVDVWAPGEDRIEALVETPDRSRYPHSLVDPQSTVFGEFKLNQGRQLNGDTRISLRIYNGRLNHIWRIIIRATEVTDGRIHAWSGTDEPATSAHLFLGGLTSDYTVGMPATVEEAIVVGSFVSQPEVTIPIENVEIALSVGDLSPFSSHGPTRKDLQKPDIVAPGQYITAALASDSVMATAERYRPRHHATGPYLALQGTSMSAPFVAGVVARMLQRCNTLTPQDVRELLTRSARSHQELNPGEWDSGYGFGLLDTKELFKLLECR